MKELFKPISYATSGLLTLFGLFELGERLYKDIHFGVATIILLILGVAIGPFLFQLARLSQLRHFGVLRGNSNKLCLEVERDIQIDAEGRTRYKKRQTLVFLGVPRQEDLWDGYAAAPDQTLESFDCTSPDSTEVKRQQRNKNVLAIFWEPKKPIIPNHHYDHETSWTSPILHKGNVFFSALSCVDATGKFREAVSSTSKVERAISFKSRGSWTPKGDLDLLQSAFRGLKDRLSQPKILDDGHTVVWEMIGPEVGTNFFCLLFFEGGEAFWRRQLEENGFKAKARKIFHRLGRDSRLKQNRCQGILKASTPVAGFAPGLPPSHSP